MSVIKKRRLGVLLLVVLWTVVFSHQLGAGGAEPHPERPWTREELRERLIWTSEEGTSALFLPEQVLNEVALEELPITGVDRSVLKDLVERFRKLPPGYCSSAREELKQGSADETLPLADFVADFKGAFVAEVISIEKGWTPWGWDVSSLAVVRVQQTVHDREGVVPENGAEVGLLFRGGTLQYHGVTICEKPIEGLYRPEVGDQILVAGSGWPDSRFFNGRAVFPIDGGMVQPVPYASITAGEVPRLVESLREEIRRQEVQR